MAVIIVGCHGSAIGKTKSACRRITADRLKIGRYRQNRRDSRLFCRRNIGNRQEIIIFREIYRESNFKRVACRLGRRILANYVISIIAVG